MGPWCEGRGRERCSMNPPGSGASRSAPSEVSPRICTGREMETSDLTWLDEPTEAVLASGFSFNPLLRTLLADPRYRAID